MTSYGKKLINSADDVVTELIEGLVKVFYELMFRASRILKWQLYQGIRAVTGPEGCLLIVKNYTGDRLNFGLAADQAKSEGLLVEMVIVGDDCASSLLFVHKVAGAAAPAGLFLSDVVAEAKRASEMIGTMGVALSVCTLPGQIPSDRLGEGKMELRLGIKSLLLAAWGARAAVADLHPLNLVISDVVKKILSPETKNLSIMPGDRTRRYATNGTVNCSLENGDRVGVGAWQGTVMKVNPAVLQRLEAPTKAPAWPVGVNCSYLTPEVPISMLPASSEKVNESRSQPRELNQQGVIIEAAIEEAAKAVIQIKDQLNEWDGKAGDADCGSTLSKGATAILEDLKTHYPLNDAAETVNEVGNSTRRSMGGTSGIIYNIFCKAAYGKLKASPALTPTPKEWAIALDAAISAVSTYGGARAGYRTILDALIPASEVLKEKLDEGVDPPTAFLLSAEGASAGAESTKHMHAQRAGHHMYPVRTLPVPDPGAMAVAAWCRAATIALDEKSRQSS